MLQSTTAEIYKMMSKFFKFLMEQSYFNLSSSPLRNLGFILYVIYCIILVYLLDDRNILIFELEDVLGEKFSIL